MTPTIEKISAVTLRVVNMTESVRFYRDVLGMELLYGGEGTGFSSLRARDSQSAILNLEQGCSGEDIRRRIVPSAQGNVLEIGVGPGLNFTHYDPARVS